MKIGVQLRPWLLETPRPSLEAIVKEARQAGYAGVEAGAQFFDWSRPQDLNQLIQPAGMRVAGIHVGGEIFDQLAVQQARGNLAAAVHFSAQVGAESLLFSGLLIERKPLAEMEAEVSVIQAAAEQAADLGLSFRYHNHWWEIADAYRELRFIRDHTDPALVSFCLDLGWVYRAGGNPIEAIELLDGRIKSVHLRDDSPHHEWRILGRGAMNLPAILGALADLDLDWAVVEPDDVKGKAYDNVIAGREYLASIAGW